MAFRFTYGEFDQLLAELIASRYSFHAFSEAPGLLATSRAPLAVLHHDVDFDVTSALALAQREYRFGCCSTYFFLLRTTHYNLFSPETTNAVMEILRMGHRLGLHFDCAAYPSDCTIDQLAAACGREAAVLENWFGHPVDVVSYHRPNALVLTGTPDLSAPRFHTYMPLFIRNMHYYADSRGQWRYGHPLESDAYRKREPLHLLMHPIWWTPEPTDPISKLRTYLTAQVEHLDRSIAHNCVIYTAASADVDALPVSRPPAA